MNINRIFKTTLGIGLVLIVSAHRAPALEHAVAQASVRPKVDYYGQFAELPVGSVQPRGWIQKWLERQAQGLTGHPENLAYPYDTCMYAGEIPPPRVPHGKDWYAYEQSAYFIDATVRLSWLMADDSLRQRREANLNYILQHSGNGRLGPARWFWPGAVIGRALLAQDSAAPDPRIQQVLKTYLLENTEAIKLGKRSEMNFEEAFYLYGRTGDKQLLNLGAEIYSNYLTNSNSFCTRAKILGAARLREHGVTAAETLKCLPLMYLYTGDREALQLADRAYQKILDHNLMADGGIVSSEYLEPTEFNSLHESCDITDWAWSMGYQLLASGEGKWADLIERAMFNALPGVVTKDFNQLQYFSGVNQFLAATADGVPHCKTRLSYRAAHDVECCSGNINRAMPNYVNRMWGRPTGAGLAALFYGPSEVRTVIDGCEVVITEETDYPFRDRITFRIQCSEPVRFDLQLRIPTWCTNASMELNGAAVLVECQSGSFATLNREFRSGDRVELQLPMAVRCEDWLRNQSVVVTRGPLVYSLKIDETRVERTYDPEDIKAVLNGNYIQGFPAVEFFPRSEWRYGTDVRTADQAASITVTESPMPDNPFEVESTPIQLQMPLYILPRWSANWRPASGLTRLPRAPGGLPNEAERLAESPAQLMTLVPYGATHLRLTTLPRITVKPTKATAAADAAERSKPQRRAR